MIFKRLYFLIFLFLFLFRSTSILSFEQGLIEAGAVNSVNSVISQNIKNQLIYRNLNNFGFNKSCKSSGKPIILRAIELTGVQNPYNRIQGVEPYRFIEFGNSNIKVKPYGYIKYEAYGDSRQVVGSGSDQLLLLPEPILLSATCSDINASPQFGMSVYESRVGFELIDLNLENQGAKTKAIFEFNLRGINDPAIITGLPESRHEVTLGSVIVRHAFLDVQWLNYNVIAGLYWHPLIVLPCFPHIMSQNCGQPFETESRNTQVRFTYYLKNLELSFTALSQLQYVSNGPSDFTAKYIRDAIIPNLNFRTIYSFENYEATVLGFSIDYKRLVPQISTDQNFKTHAAVDSIIFEAFGSIIKEPWSLRSKIIYSENAADQGLISGYGVHTFNETTGCATYTPTRAMSAWLDFSYTFCCDQMEFGFYAAYTKNLGAKKSLYFSPETGEPILYTLIPATNITDSAFRLSPRWVLAWNNMRIGLELEWTQAHYGDITRSGKIANAYPISNVRLLSAAYYLF